jgi:hypothetical protein
MDKITLREKTKSVIRKDRLELIRELSDTTGTYCFFASMYEIAYHILGDKLPPRAKQAETEWLSYGREDGYVEHGDIIDLMLKMANAFGIRIQEIYLSPANSEVFLRDKVSEAKQLETSTPSASSPPEKVYVTHSESGSSRKSFERVSELSKTMDLVLAVNFSDTPSGSFSNTRETVKVHYISETEEFKISYPFYILMSNKDESEIDGKPSISFNL